SLLQRAQNKACPNLIITKPDMQQAAENPRNVSETVKALCIDAAVAAARKAASVGDFRAISSAAAAAAEAVTFLPSDLQQQAPKAGAERKSAEEENENEEKDEEEAAAAAAAADMASFGSPEI